MSPTNDDMVEALLRPIHQALENQGLTPTYLTKKLKRELNAKKTTRIKVKGAVNEESLARGKKVVARSNDFRVGKDGTIYGDGDSVIESNEIDWSTRQRAREDAHKLRGDYAPAKTEHSGSVVVERTDEERAELKEIAQGVARALQMQGKE